MIDWWTSLEEASQIAVSSAFIGAAIGGLLSLFGALIVLSINHHLERKKKLQETEAAAAWAAYRGLQKLMNDLNAVENLARHLDSEFRRAQGNEEINEPALFIRQIVGAPDTVVFLEQDEMRFLVGHSNDLIQDISEIQRRIRNDLHFVNKYNDLKNDYDNFMISLDEIALKVDGEIAGAELKGVNAKKAEIKIGRMNLLISDVIASLDEDRVKIVDIVRDYIEHGRKAYGDKFPANELEIKEPR